MRRLIPRDIKLDSPQVRRPTSGRGATGPGLTGTQDARVSVPTCAHLFVHLLILHLTEDDEDEDEVEEEEEDRKKRNKFSSRCWWDVPVLMPREQLESRVSRCEGP